MKKGDIISVEMPMANGHEQGGLRLAVIVQSEGLGKLPTILIVPMTSQLKAGDFPYTFVIEPDLTNNLKEISVVLVFQLRAIDKRRVKGKIGELGNKKMALLKQNLVKIMGLSL